MRMDEMRVGQIVHAIRPDGWHGSIMFYEVLKINRVTVTVKTEQGEITRVKPSYFDQESHISSLIELKNQD